LTKQVSSNFILKQDLYWSKYRIWW